MSFSLGRGEMDSLFRTKIFRRLFLSILGITVFNLGLLSFIIILRSQSLIEKRELEIASSYRMQITERLSSLLDERKSDILQLATDLSIDLSSPIGDSRYKARLFSFFEHQDFYTDMFISLPDGSLKVGMPRDVPPGLNVGDREYHREAMMGSVYVSGYFIDRITNSMHLAVSAPIYAEFLPSENRSGDTPVGILVGLIPLQKVAGIVHSLSLLGKNGSCYIVDENYEPIQSEEINPSAFTNVSSGKTISSFVISDLMTQTRGAAKYVNAEGETVFGSYEWLGTLKLGLIVELYAEIALRPMRDILRFIAIFACIMLFSFIFDSLFLSYRHLRPIGALIGAVEKVSASHYQDMLNISTNTEFDQLIDLFNSMMRAIQDREDALKESASRDSLTGLYNHGCIEEFLDHEIRRSRRSHAPIAFVMVDIDHFKRINDTYGHQAGDAILRGLAEILERNAREGDLVGRYGGEEFAVIFNTDSADTVGVFCERIRQAVEGFEFEFDGKRISVTVSVGWAMGDSGLSTPFDLVHKADMALYEAKASGRNCVRRG
jgi:diguanylate cyclase (GGDEF)-like protein